MVNILNLLEQFIFPLEVILGTGPFCKMKSSPATLINILGISTDDGPSHHQMMFFFVPETSGGFHKCQYPAVDG